MGVANINFEYNFATKPFAEYQNEGFELTRDKKTYAYFWEQGLGKTWLLINVARYRFERGDIDALLITAPNGVHANWIPELYKHLPADFPWEAMVWWPSEAHKYWSESAKANMRDFVNQKDKLIILLTAYHAFLYDKSHDILKQFLKERKVFWALDESDDIGNPSSKWTKRILRLAPRAVVRRVATGTPYKDGTPLAYWSQFEFLHPQIIGLRWLAFRMRYAVWTLKELPGRPYKAMIPVKDYKTGRQKFQNLEELETKISIRALRKTKAEVMPDLPPKVFDKLYVELSQDQLYLYEKLRDEAILEWKDKTETIIDMAMLIRLRLQQIACGFYPVDGEEPEQRLGGEIPRLEIAVTEICRSSSQTIVWARFRMDIDMLCEELERLEPGNVVRYDGTVNDKNRDRAITRFRDHRDAKFMVANPAVGARGYTFTNSHRAFFYSNYQKLLPRIQAEDRQHRIGTTNAVLITDVLARDTVDETIVAALRGKKNVADYLMGRPFSEWI